MKSWTGHAPPRSGRRVRRAWPARRARRHAQRMRLRPDQRLDQPEEGAPPLHRLAVVMDGDCLVAIDTTQARPRLGDDVTRNRHESRADRLARTQHWLVRHATL